MKKRTRKKPTKKPTKKGGKRRSRKIPKLVPYIYRRYQGYGIDEASDWEYDASRVRMLCINCYGQYYIWSHDRYEIKNWFCDECRKQLTPRKWSLLKKFHKHIEVARFRKNNPANLSHGDVLGFTNSLFRCIRGKAAREVVIKTMKLGIDLAKYADPIILGNLLDRYDKIMGIQAKKRNDRR